MESLHKNILELTEKIEQQLGTDFDLETLLALLGERRKIFSKLQEAPVNPDTEAIIRQILASEKKCVALAMEKKKELKADLQETRNRKRLHQTYGKSIALG
jgi:hypothetical protein